MNKVTKGQLTLEPSQCNLTIYNEDGSLLLVSISTEWLNDNHGKKNLFCIQNIETGEIKQVLNSIDQFQGIKNARFSVDGKGFFYLATKPDAKSFVNDGEYTKTPNTIFYYDLQTNQSEEIWRIIKPSLIMLY